MLYNIIFLLFTFNINFINNKIKLTRFNNQINIPYMSLYNNSIENEFNIFKNKYIKNKILNEMDNIIEKNIIDDQNNKINEKKLFQLQLLNSVNTINWITKWIYDMVKINYTFPFYVYNDIFIMRDLCHYNKNKTDFYIGFYPENIICNEGPYYIVYCKLNVKFKIIFIYTIVQNPNYYNGNKTYFNELKKTIIIMSKKSNVTLNHNRLKKNNYRYWISWNYNEYI